MRRAAIRPNVTLRRRPTPKTSQATRDRRAKKRARERQYAINRALVLGRDGYQCRHCGLACHDWWPLHVHHVKPRSRGRDDSTANLVSLCPSCHAAVHDARLTISGNADEQLAIRWVA